MLVLITLAVKRTCAHCTVRPPQVIICHTSLLAAAMATSWYSFLMGAPQKVPPAELFRTWKRELEQEQRRIGTEIRKLESAQIVIKNEIRKLAKNKHVRGNEALMNLRAKDFVRQKAVIARLYNANAHINGIINEMRTQQVHATMMSALSASTVVMRHLNDSMKIPEVRATMQQLSMQMDRAGFIEGLIDDTMEGLDPDDIEEEADAEMSQVLDEILAPLPAVRALPQLRQATSAQQASRPAQVSAAAAAAPAGE